MANIENLVPLTTEKAREIGAKGGKRSGEVKREKRTFKKAIEWLANSDIKLKGGSVYDALKGMGIDVDTLNPTQLATIGLWYGAVQGNATNYKTLMEGNNEIEEEGSVNPTFKVEIIDNSNLEKQLYEANKPK